MSENEPVQESVQESEADQKSLTASEMTDREPIQAKQGGRPLSPLISEQPS